MCVECDSLGASPCPHSHIATAIAFIGLSPLAYLWPTHFIWSAGVSVSFLPHRLLQNLIVIYVTGVCVFGVCVCVCVCFVSCARRGFSNEIAANYSHYVFGGLHFKLIVVYISQSKGQRNGALWFAEEDGAIRWMIEFWNRNRQ